MTKMETTGYIVYFFNFTFVLCIFPFRISRKVVSLKQGTGSEYNHLYIAKFWWPQTLTCLFNTIVSSFWFVRDVRISIPFNSKNPKLYVRFASSLVGFLIKLVTLKLIWLEKDRILRIVNFVAEAERQSKWLGLSVKSKRKLSIVQNKYFVLVICLLTFAVTIFNVHVGRELQGTYGADTTKAFGHVIRNLKILEAEARYNFFLNNDTEIGNLLLAVTFSGFAYNHFLVNFADVLAIMIVLTLWMPVKSFAEYLEEDMQHIETHGDCNNLENCSPDVIRTKLKKIVKKQDFITWSTIYKTVQFLKTLSTLVSNCVGNCITMFIVASVAFYAASIDDVFVKYGKEFDLGKGVRLLHGLATGFSLFLLAADIPYQVCMQ